MYTYTHAQHWGASIRQKQWRWRAGLRAPQLHWAHCWARRLQRRAGEPSSGLGPQRATLPRQHRHQRWGWDLHWGWGWLHQPPLGVVTAHPTRSPGRGCTPHRAQSQRPAQPLCQTSPAPLGSARWSSQPQGSPPQSVSPAQTPRPSHSTETTTRQRTLGWLHWTLRWPHAGSCPAERSSPAWTQAPQAPPRAGQSCQRLPLRRLQFPQLLRAAQPRARRRSIPTRGAAPTFSRSIR